jgi:LacI family transcriptional regulator
MRVQLLIGGGLEYFRDVMLGVRHYGFETGRLEFADRWLPHEGADLAALARRDRVEGIVAAVDAPRAMERLCALRVPVVNVSNTLVDSPLPLVTQDDVAVGRLAARHLAGCGCRTAAFCGPAGLAFSEERLAGFRQAWRQVAPGEVRVMDAWPGADQQGYRRMVRWLAGLPRGVGVFAVMDELALALIRAARELGRAVPEEVAILGAGDDDFWVEFESVPLSSIRLPARAIGYEAGAMIDELMRTGRRRAPARRLPVGEVAARRSTAVVFAEDEAVARAVRFIREHATRSPYVAEVARAAGVSRSALQVRFKATLGRTILQEVGRCRMEAAATLLRATDLKLAVVAERCGFPNSQRFSVLFRRSNGVTPRDYRQAVRSGAS